MTNVVLVRPGATSYDEEDRIQGRLDIPMSDRGIEEVARLAERFAEPWEGQELAAVYCAPTDAAIRTAETIGRVVGLRPKRLDDLKNLDQGLWQGLQRSEIKMRHPKVYRQWLDDPTSVSPPQAESFEDAVERVEEALRPLIRRHEDEFFAIVAADPIARIVAACLRKEPHVAFDDHSQTGFSELIEVVKD